MSIPMSSRRSRLSTVRGRRLWIGTTNIDATRPVLWNIGEIANSKDPRAPALIHDVMLASASIPGAFPPVSISVAAEGKSYEELHVDGGVTEQVFSYPADWTGRRFSIVSRCPASPTSTSFVMPSFTGLQTDQAVHNTNCQPLDLKLAANTGHRRPLPHVRHG